MYDFKNAFLYRIDAGMSSEDLVQWRTRLQLKQIEAAALLGVSERTIAYYESGERNISFDKFIVCTSYENWPWLRAQIPHIIAKRLGHK